MIKKNINIIDNKKINNYFKKNNNSFFFLKYIIKKKLFKKYDLLNYKNSNFLRLKNYEKLKFEFFKKKKNYLKILSKNKFFNFKDLKKKLSFKNILINNFLIKLPKPIIKKIYKKILPKIIINLKKLLIKKKIIKMKQLIIIKKIIKIKIKKKKKKIIKIKKKNKLINYRKINEKLLNNKKKIKFIMKKIFKPSNVVITKIRWFKKKKNWNYHFLILKYNIRYWNMKFHYLKFCWWYYNIIGKISKFKKKKFYNIIKNDFLIPLLTIPLFKKKKINNKNYIKKKAFIIFSNFFFLNNLEINFNIMNIRLTCNNTSIVVTKSNGIILFGLTTGILKFKGSKKNTFVATLTVAKHIYWKIINKNIHNLKIVYKSSKRRAKLKHLLRLFSKAFKKKKIKILALINNTLLPYNGSKKKKKRR